MSGADGDRVVAIDIAHTRNLSMHTLDEPPPAGESPNRLLKN